MLFFLLLYLCYIFSLRMIHELSHIARHVPLPRSGVWQQCLLKTFLNHLNNFLITCFEVEIEIDEKVDRNGNLVDDAFDSEWRSRLVRWWPWLKISIGLVPMWIVYWWKVALLLTRKSHGLNFLHIFLQHRTHSSGVSYLGTTPRALTTGCTPLFLASIITTLVNLKITHC